MGSGQLPGTPEKIGGSEVGRGSNIIPSHLMLGKPRVRDKLLIRMKKVLARPTKRLCEYLFAVKS